MAGVPYHAASSYVQRLLEQGFKVAICEQMADPSKVKGIVPREVVRVASPGIAYDDAGIEARKNHYLAAVERAAAVGPFGIAALDLSTGELSACEAPDLASAVAELVRLAPREVLLGPEAAAELAKPLAEGVGARSCGRPSDAWTQPAPMRCSMRSSERAKRARRVPRSSLGARRPGASPPPARARRGGRCPSRGSPFTRWGTRCSSTRRRRRIWSSCAPWTAGSGARSWRRSTRPRRRRGHACCAGACSLRSRPWPTSAGATTESSSSCASRGCAPSCASFWRRWATSSAWRSSSRSIAPHRGTSWRCAGRWPPFRS